MKYNIKSIQMIYDYILDQSMYSVLPGVFLNALFYNTAAAIGAKRIFVERESNRGPKKIIPNYFGITFSISGAGKDHSLNKTTEIFGTFFDKVTALGQSFYDESRDSDGQPNGSYINPSSYFIPVKSSGEGIQKTAQTWSDAGFGSVNVYETELGNRILSMEPIFDILKKAWDTGTFEGQINAGNGGKNYFRVTDMPCNMILFGAPGPFLQDPKRQDALIMAYISGIARRAFIYHNKSFKKSQNKNPNFETMPMEDIEAMDQYLKELKSFLNNTEKIYLPKDVHRMLIEYDDSKQIARERSHSPIAEDLGAPQKIEKLLGIIATLDLSNTITKEHLDFAIEFTEMMDETAEETVELKPDHVLIYNELEQRNFMSRSDIVKAVRGVNLSSLADHMVLVEEQANSLGNSIIKKEYGKVVQYKLEKLSSSDISSAIISVNEDPNKFNPKGFEKKKGNFFNLHTIINSKMRYSAGTFKDSYISDENYLQEQNLFIIDVDDGMTIKEAQDLFKDMTYLMATTKSHQVKKSRSSGDIPACDRFRIILPTSATFHLSPTDYSAMYMNVLDALGMEEADEKCRNSSRWYYGFENGEHWYNEGKLLDIRPFLPDSSQKVASDAALSNYEKEGETFATEDRRVDGALRWFFRTTAKGNRHDQLFRLALTLRTRIQVSNWDGILRHANSCLTDPISDNDLKSTIKSASNSRYS